MGRSFVFNGCYAGVHFIMIGAYELQPQPAPYTSTNMLISDTQIAWITNDLASVDRTVTPWIVAMFHPREHHPFPFIVSPLSVVVLHYRPCARCNKSSSSTASLLSMRF